jgi:hypothetical protein
VVFAVFYLLLDDSLQIHEKLGGFISYKLNFSSWLNLRPQDFGELSVSILVSLFFLIFISTTYYFSDRFSRKISKYLIMALFALALFGNCSRYGSHRSQVSLIEYFTWSYRRWW